MLRSWRVGISLLLAPVALGWSAAGGAHAAATPGGMRFVQTRPPAGDTLARGPANLAFITRRRGFAATTGGRHFVGHVGWVLPSDAGALQATNDGGATWRTLWRGRLSFDSIAARARMVAATGVRLPTSGRLDRHSVAGDRGRTRRVLMVSTDQGRTWRRRPRLPVTGHMDLQMVGPRLWLALRAGEPYGPRSVLSRSVDAGRHWRAVSVPPGTWTVAFVTGRVGLASARSRSCRRRWGEPATQLWRTTDGGRRWRPLAGTCPQPDATADLQALSRRVVFAVQAGEEDPTVLRRSTDGGASWQTLARDRARARAAVQVHFRDRRHGSLVEYAGRSRSTRRLTLLASTADGGRTWSRHGVPADSPVAFAGRDAWTGDDLSGVVWHSHDAGRVWRLTASARSLDPDGVGWNRRVTLSSPGTVVVHSGAGPVASADGGRTWTPARWPSQRARAIAERTNAFLDDNDRIRLVTRTGTTGVRAPRGVEELDDVAFTSARDGALVTGFDEAVRATHDGGRTWSSIAPPWRRSGQPAYPSFAVGPGLIAAHGAGDRVLVTADEGASWRTLELPPRAGAGSCAISRPSVADIWLTCGSRVGTIVFKSADAGLTWERHIGQKRLDADLRGTGAGEAWATSLEHPDVGESAATLWHTVDGGATWTQAWDRPGPVTGARPRGPRRGHLSVSSAP